MASKRTYSETEKLGTMMLALDVGVVAASEQTKTPQPTIYTWFQDAGGIVGIRSFAEAGMLKARLVAHQAVYDAVAKRVADAGEGEVFTTFRELVRAAAEKEDAAPPGAQAGAQASAIVIQISPDEVIEVPRDRQA